MSVGAIFLCIFANYFFKDLIKEIFLNKLKNLEIKFRENEFTFFLIYRFVGGIPFPIQNLLPVLFNMKVKNYFFSTLIGLFPMVFILCAIGSGIEKIVEENINPSFLIMIQNREILFPILGFFVILMFSFILRKIYFKK